MTTLAATKTREVEVGQAGGDGDDLVRDRGQAFDEDDPEAVLLEAVHEGLGRGLVVVEVDERGGDGVVEGVADEVAEDAAGDAGQGAEEGEAVGALRPGQDHGDEQRVWRDREEAAFGEADDAEPERRLPTGGEGEDTVVKGAQHVRPMP